MPIGTYRRAVRIQAQAHSANAEMEDDNHHFAVCLAHDGRVIQSVQVQSIRAPWTTCPSASAALEALAGRLIGAPIAFASPTERYANCTHMLDLADLAAAHAGGPGFARRYDIEIDFGEDHARHGRLEVDGECFLDWTLRTGRIVGGKFDDATPAALMKRADVAADPDLSEAISVFRRAFHIAGARGVDLDGFDTVEQLGELPPTCHTLLAAVRAFARRNRGTAVDFWAAGRRPLAEAVEPTTGRA